jgi:hypothetical protein
MIYLYIRSPTPFVAFTGTSVPLHYVKICIQNKWVYVLVVFTSVVLEYLADRSEFLYSLFHALLSILVQNSNHTR